MRIRFLCAVGAAVLIVLLLAGISGGAKTVFAAPEDAQANALWITPDSVTFESGAAKDFILTLNNTTAEGITNVRLSASGAGVTASIDPSAGDMAAGERKQVTAVIYGAKVLDTTTAYVTINASYLDAGGKPQAQALTVSVTLTAPKEEPPQPSSSPVVVGTPRVYVSQPITSVVMEAGRSYSVDITLANSGSASANLVNITLVPNPNISVNIPNGKIAPFTINQNGSKTFTVTVRPDKDLAAGAYSARFEYSYIDDARRDYSGTGEIYIKLEKTLTDNSPANITIGNVSVDKARVTRGDDFTISMDIKNVGAQAANGVLVSLDGLKTGEITASNSLTSRSIGNLKQNEGSRVSFTLNADAKIAAGSWPVSIRVVYNDADGKDITRQTAYYVTIAPSADALADDGRADVTLSNWSVPEAKFEVGQVANIAFRVENTGDKTAKNIKITAAADAAIVPRAANVITIKSLAPGSSADVSFAFSPTEEARTQSYSIGFTVEYETGEVSGDNKVKDTFMQYAAINVFSPLPEKSPEAESKPRSIPKIIISKYEISPLIVQAGQEFDIDLSFQNTHPTKKVSNITVSLSVIGGGSETDKGNVFTPVDSSNIFYIPEIAPKGEIEQHIRMYVVPDAKAKNYIITANFDYEDEEGNQLTNKADFGVNVKQVSKLELGDYYFPTDMMVGTQQYISFSVHNTGKVTLYNLKIKVEGEGIDNTASEQIFGNFTSGSVDYYDGNFTPQTPGAATLKLVISYDDDTGKHIEDAREYECNINDNGGMMGDGGDYFDGLFDGGMNPDAPANSVAWYIKALKSWITWVVVGCIAAGVAAIVTIRVIRRRKQDADDD